jgi:excisionase family DNA binding protein
MARSPQDEVLTLDEAAARLKLARKTVRDWVRAGKLPGFKLGRVWRVKASAVEQAIAAAEARQPRPVPVPDAGDDEAC